MRLLARLGTNRRGVAAVEFGYQFGPNAGCIAQPLIRLTDSFSAVKAGMDGMVAGGDANIAAGVMWGWHTLSPNAPFADGAAYSDDTTRKIMVLMTDGENHNVVTSSPNASVYGGLGYIWQNRLGITDGSLDERRLPEHRQLDREPAPVEVMRPPPAARIQPAAGDRSRTSAIQLPAGAAQGCAEAAGTRVTPP